VISGQRMTPKRDALSVSERAYGLMMHPTLSRRISYRVLLTTTSGRLGIDGFLSIFEGIEIPFGSRAAGGRRPDR
jgi:hypothetical protein